MEWAELLLSFVEKQTGHLVTLIVAFAWPVVVIVLLYTQRRSLAKVINGLQLESLKVGNSEAKFGRRLQENAATVAQAVAVAETKPVDAPALDPADDLVQFDLAVEDAAPHLAHRDIKQENLIGHYADMSRKLAEYMKSAPSVVIDKAWGDVRKALYRVVSVDTTIQSWLKLEGMPDRELMHSAAGSNKLGPKLLQAIMELQMIHADATTMIGWQPNQQQAADYVENASQVIALLNGPAFFSGS